MKLISMLKMNTLHSIKELSLYPNNYETDGCETNITLFVQCQILNSVWVKLFTYKLLKKSLLQ